MRAEGGTRMASGPPAESNEEIALLATAASDGAGPDGAMPARGDTPLEPGQRVGEYRVEGFLGEGAFGTVYRGVHPLIAKQVAIKVLSLRYSVDPGVVSRFIDEARAVNTIGHSGIIDIFSFGALSDGRQYYVMELLDGLTLRQLIEQRGRLPLAEALGILRQMARALDAAHAAGIAHRDLKPANVFLARDDDGWRAKVLDFGVAKLLGETEGEHRTETGATVGTPSYMSPEQCLGKGVDHRSDVYAFGVVTFEMLTGHLPFEADSVFSIMAAHINEPTPEIHHEVPALRPAVSRAIARMMAKRPEERPGSLVEAVDGLAAAAAGTLDEPRRRPAWPLAAAGLLLAGGAAILWWPDGDTGPPAAPAPVAVMSRDALVRADAAPTDAAPADVAPMDAVIVVDAAPSAADASRIDARARRPRRPSAPPPTPPAEPGVHDLEPW